VSKQVGFLAALQFLTSIPLPWRREARPEELGRSTAYFPVVGLIIGLILASLNWVFLLIVPPAVANVLLLVMLAIITGALHLDGFADTCDGLAGHKVVEDRWRVMRDSRSGVFGIVGVVLLLLVKYASLSSIPQYLMLATLIFMPVIGRWAMVYAIFTYRYARPSGLGTAFKGATRWPRFAIATSITFVIAIALVPMLQSAVFAVLVAVWIVTVVVAAYFKSKFSGLTGDTYGAINEIAEVSVLIFIIILVRLGMV